MRLDPEGERLELETERLGRFLVAHLFILFKTAQNYGEGHSAIEAPAGNLYTVLSRIRQIDVELTLSLNCGTLYLGGVRLKPECAAFKAYRFVAQEMEEHDIGAIRFGFGVSAEELARFAGIFLDEAEVPAADPFHRALERMQVRMIHNIEVETVPEERDSVETTGESNHRCKARALYLSAVAVIEQIVTHARSGWSLSLRDCKRVVQRIIDHMASNSSSLLGMTTMHREDANSHYHAVNVCIISLALGKKVGMSKVHLCELGMAALFHNIGKADFPREVADRQGEPSIEERHALEEHPIHGVKVMMSLKSMDTMNSRIISGIFEHHLLADFSGFPSFFYNRLGLNGRIISVADRYDVLTSSWVGRRPPLPPDKALRLMLSRSGKDYDKALLKLLLVCLGMHGIGSLLLLESRELAVVVESNSDPDFWDTPRVKIIADPEGREIDGEMVNLTDAVPGRAIVAILDPNQYRIDVSQYFL